MRVLMVEKSGSLSTSKILDTRSVAVCAEDTDEAFSLLRYETYDVVVVNLESQTREGFDFIRRVRAIKNDTPILALTGLKVDDRVKALSLGADDAVALPVDPAEFRARLTSVLRRSRGFSQSLLSVGDLTVCLTTHEVRFKGVPVRLTPKEVTILELMVLRKGLLQTKSVLLNHLYSGMDEPEAKIIDVFVCKLRKKLERAGAVNLIVTVWGHGYTMHDPETRRTPSADPAAAAAADLKLVA